MRIAVWNTAFLGDALLSLPLMRALRDAWPRAQLDMYIRQGLGSFLSSQKMLTHVYEVGKTDRTLFGMLRLMRQINTRSYNIWIGAHQSPRSSMFAIASNAPVRVGYSGAWHRETAYTTTVPRRFGELDEIERLLELLHPLDAPDMQTEAALGSTEWQSVAPRSGWPPTWPEVWPELDLSSRSREAAAAFWKKLAPGPVLGIHPGSVWATKRWAPEGFAFVAKKAEEAGANVILLAGENEAELGAEVLKIAGLSENNPRIHNLSGRLSLEDLAAWLARLDSYLTNDSGPMHLAWLQHTPVVALFGPTVREFGFFPRGELARIVEAPETVCLTCRPCGLHGPQECPRGDHACMISISPEKVWQRTKEQLFGLQEA